MEWLIRNVDTADVKRRRLLPAPTPLGRGSPRTPWRERSSMTMRGFGNVLPIHIAMLQLAGFVVDDRSQRLRRAAGAAERLQTMREGHEDLCGSTGLDLGYDLAAWRDYLLGNPEHQYTHEYAFHTVDEAILAALTDHDRQQAADLLEQEGCQGR